MLRQRYILKPPGSRRLEPGGQWIPTGCGHSPGFRKAPFAAFDPQESGKAATEGVWKGLSLEDAHSAPPPLLVSSELGLRSQRS